MSVSAYGSIRSLPDEALAKSGPACRFDQLRSARALVVHRRNEVGFLPARASQASTSEGLDAKQLRGAFVAPGIRRQGERERKCSSRFAASVVKKSCPPP